MRRNSKVNPNLSKIIARKKYAERQIDKWVKWSWNQRGKIKYKEDVVTGLENAPSAFIGLMNGKNFGKLLIKVAE